ncbi:Predicted metal-dependent enzyme of the double-stranded beta helix superfamily [Shimia gijangensis]|uniref:Predicted metal-dependent enzyme of the double-stranded beta helix superfamily n=1 Tax=Shimia gijangensis TaxID=1470563 RepID=A0A1M6P0T6_9RHOB|nr:hypothetical protein [Shimia gijangensis]SHK01503.1 Predicted metal-dependent enzyme of the double-stranded beta helix superfamily [Shimia gijangensis]
MTSNNGWTGKGALWLGATGYLEIAAMAQELNVQDIIARLRVAATQDDATKAVRAIVEEVVADPESAAHAFGDPGEDVILYEDETVSIWYTHFHPAMAVPAHDHQLSACIGVFHGRERNDLFEAGPDGGIRKSSEVFLEPGDVFAIGPKAIHSVACVSEGPCNGLHVYLGNLTEVDRTLFDVDTGRSMKFDDANYERLMAADRFASG